MCTKGVAPRWVTLDSTMEIMVQILAIPAKTKISRWFILICLTLDLGTYTGGSSRYPWFSWPDTTVINKKKKKLDVKSDY